jgi:alkanesulfonate monooxygenase SsuD/methylene tetrahydromethanopterin reductase-like flavin-dependent oxidoreductase (luciferase family)
MCAHQGIRIQPVTIAGQSVRPLVDERSIRRRNAEQIADHHHRQRGRERHQIDGFTGRETGQQLVGVPREPVVDFTGRYHRLDRVAVLPRPRRELPLWFGGHTDAALRRAARAGDGLVVTPPEVHGLGPHTIEPVRRFVDEAGRDPAAFGFDAIVRVPNPGWEAHVDAWRDADATYVSLVIEGLAVRMSSEITGPGRDEMTRARRGRG